MKILIAILAVQFLVQTTHGHSMGRESGGGDICEARFKDISSDIRKWIEYGGAQHIKFPSGWNQSRYSKTMLLAINSTKISCVNQNDQDYPVHIDGTPKICKFDRGSNDNRVTCDFTKFQAISESDQYVLVHHEFAGIAGIETPNGDDSDYLVSGQITGYLVDQIVKRLAVKAPGMVTEWNSKFVKVSLGKGSFCGEFDPYIVGDACRFTALDDKKNLYIIYDSASGENSDLAMPANEHKITEGTNCFITEIYQTKELVSKYGNDAYFSKVLKRISCK